MPPLQKTKDFIGDSEHSQIDASPAETDVKDVAAPFVEGLKSVTFSTVQIRTYNRVVGDHPDCRVGPPVSIGWDYLEQDSQPLGQYENDRGPRGLTRLTSLARKALLRNEFDIPEEEIRAAEKEVQLILRSRDKAKRQTKLAEKVSAVKSARRKMKRLLLGETFMKGLAAAAGAMMTPMGPGSAGMAVY